MKEGREQMTEVMLNGCGCDARLVKRLTLNATDTPDNSIRGQARCATNERKTQPVVSVLRPPSSVLRPPSSGFTLAESMVVIVIVSLMVAMAAASLKGVITRNSFKSQTAGLVSALEAASTTAGQTGKRYEVIIDIPRQSWLLREITSPDLSEVLEEEIIAEEEFAENCRVAYVLFDDGEFTNQDRAKFRASRIGWQFGGIIVLEDADHQFWSIVIDRLSNIVRLQPGEAQIAWPRSKDELPF